MDGEYWYKYIKEHKPDVLGKDIIDYVEQLKLDKEALEKQLILSGVSNRRKQLIDFCTKLELKAKQYSYLIPDEDFIDEYLKDN
jgi:hypothetical protein